MTYLKMAVDVPRALPRYLAAAAPVTFAEGFYAEEREGIDTYRWMGLSGRLSFEPSAAERYLELAPLSEFQDLSQRLTVEAAGREQTFDLVGGWQRLPVVVPAGAGDLALCANKIFPRAYYPTDTRELAVRVRPPVLHEDAHRHAEIARQYANAVTNLREMADGRTRLSSTPVSLGIDLHGACNVNPPCVYCEWDFNKALEGDNVDTPFTLETLKDFGPFFDNASSLVNCSIGEPFMMKPIDDLFDAFDRGGKLLEMTTNGQILTDRNIQKLIGRSVDLYVSLDAGTRETYAKLRNDRFDVILRNLRRLIEAKGGPGHLPRVHLVFMPMRVNVRELDDFVRICADLAVDCMVLRPLNYSDSTDLEWERAGYRYRYQDELLPFEELVWVSGRAMELCRQLRVPLADQMNFGGSMGEMFREQFEAGRRSVVSAAAPAAEAAEHAAPVATAPGASPVAQAKPETSAPTTGPDEPLPSLGTERRPLCVEPWKSMYILRRGILPCCYGALPVAPMGQHREAWNSPLLQAIRGKLAGGRFHPYCLRSLACPIVRKSDQAHVLPMAQALRLRARKVSNRLDRLTAGVWGHVFYRTKWLGIRAARALTNPRYVVHHAKRLVGRTSGPSDPKR